MDYFLLLPNFDSILAMLKECVAFIIMQQERDEIYILV
jgi:hypothetical protein